MKTFPFLDFILTYYFLIFQGVRYKTVMFYVSQYPQLVEALEEIKQCNLDVNWPTINDQDRVLLKRYQGNGSVIRSCLVLVGFPLIYIGLFSSSM